MIAEDREEAAERDEERDRLGRNGAGAEEPNENADLVAGEFAEGLLRGEPGGIRAGEAGRQISEAQRDHRDGHRRGDDHQNGCQIHESVNRLNQKKSTGTDHAVDAQKEHGPKT